MNYGINNSLGKPERMQVFEILDCAFENGINKLDTADAYGDSIDVLGEYNKAKPNRFLINSKFVYSGRPIRDELNFSLKRLHADSLNTYFYHRFHDFIRYPQLGDDLIKLKSERKIQKIGLSIYSNQEFELGLDSEFIDVLQIPFNLFDNYSQRGKYLDLAKARGKEIHARSIFLQGLFLMNKTSVPVKLHDLGPFLEKIQKLAANYSITIEELALNYALSHRQIEYFLIGVDNVNQLEKDIYYINNSKDLSDELIKHINTTIRIPAEMLNPGSWV